MHRRALRSLSAVAGTLLPGSETLPSAPAMGVVDRFDAEFLDRLPEPRSRRDLVRLLRLLDTHAGGALLHGSPRPFAGMDERSRAAALRRMARSPLPAVRLGFKALKGALGMMYMHPPPGHTGGWEPWQVIGYPGPIPTPPAPGSGMPTQAPEPGATWRTDVVVVGSGAGGGTAAAVLASAGLDVVVVEKGGHVGRGGFPRREPEALDAMYMDRGLASTVDGGITLLAGATLGGGTVVNYTTALSPPGSLLAEWDSATGFDRVFTGEAFEESVGAVRQRIDVTLDESDPSPRDRILERGLEALGWHVGALPRNVAGCSGAECGFCGMGCRLGAKRSSLETWLRDAAAAGAILLSGAEVGSVIVEDGRAAGVRVDPGGMIIRARAVVLAAGSLHTPAILLRSGVDARPVGRHLHLHPVTAVWGLFPDRVEQWTGMLQTRYSNEFADLDGARHGFTLETAAVHQTFPPLMFGWDGGEEFHADLARMAHWSPVGILLRDRGEGRVTVGRGGRPRWRYRFDRRDLTHLAQGVEKAAEVLAAAGAEEVIGSTLLASRWRRGEGAPAADLAARVRRRGLGANHTVYVSFHQMGSARMGADPGESVVGADNEAHAVPGLYVMDASAFPSASGINPALTIQAIAHRAASLLAERIG